jgi:predicted phage terminase large subunit-like protein
MATPPFRLEEVRAVRAKRKLLRFIKSCHYDFKANWFHESLCAELERFYADVLAGRNPKLMICSPPRHGKTSVVNAFSAWALGQNPDLNIIAASYAASLAEKNCRDVQRIIGEPTYRAIFPDCHLRSARSNDAAERGISNSEMFEIAGHRGGYRAAGVGGGITGLGFDVGLIDDPLRDHEEAYSEVIREKIWNWYQTTFLTRASPIGGIILINTRWHGDDLSGRLLQTEPEKWRLVSYKAIATEDEPHRKAGEALHPERYSIEKLHELEASLGPVFFSAMYQQTPTPAGGNLFREEMFDFSECPQEFDWTFITADTAYSDKQENDYTVFALWGVKNEELYLADILRRRMKSSETESQAVAFIKGYSTYGFRGALIEPKGHGIYLNQKLPQMGVCMPPENIVKEFYKDRTRSKVERANLAIPFLGNRKVHINQRINGKEEILNEILTFPKAKNDDVTDCTIDAIKYSFFSREISTLDVVPQLANLLGFPFAGLSF